EGNVLGTAKTLTSIGEIARLQGDFGRAVLHNEEAMRLFTQLSNPVGICVNLLNLGWLNQRMGNNVEATRHFRQSLELAQQVHHMSAVVTAVAGLGGVAAACQQPEPAVRLFGAVEAQQEIYTHALCAADEEDFERCVALARDQIDPATFSRLWEAGRKLRL